MTTCPNCGAPATKDDVFCSGCGQRLPQPGSAAPSGQPPLPPMPGPPPASTPGQQVGYTPTRKQVVQPTYQQPVAPSYAQSPAQQPSVIQPSYDQGGADYVPPQPAAPPRKKNRGCLIAIIVVVVLGLCAALMVGGAAILPEILDRINQPNTDGGTSGGSDTVPIDVVNNLDYDICYLYISPSSSDDWGDDWLGDTGVIEPGFTMTFYLTAGETVDIQAEDCDGYIIDNQYNVDVPDDGLTYTLSP